MPGITREEVAHLARLARLELKGEELDHFAGQLDASSARSPASPRSPTKRTADLPPAAADQCHARDEVRPSLTPEQALSSDQAQEQQRFKVPQILGED
ncbi:Asp-tRNA(Asn)/Glu-tRNA(Gln) amidotransferase subunit GatC [Streptomyces tanashiensis]